MLLLQLELNIEPLIEAARFAKTRKRVVALRVSPLESPCTLSAARRLLEAKLIDIIFFSASEDLQTIYKLVNDPSPACDELHSHHGLECASEALDAARTLLKIYPALRTVVMMTLTATVLCHRPTAEAAEGTHPDHLRGKGAHPDILRAPRAARTHRLLLSGPAHGRSRNYTRVRWMLVCHARLALRRKRRGR